MSHIKINKARWRHFLSQSSKDTNFKLFLEFFSVKAKDKPPTHEAEDRHLAVFLWKLIWVFTVSSYELWRVCFLFQTFSLSFSLQRFPSRLD